jgi:hypothetical protein
MSKEEEFRLIKFEEEGGGREEEDVRLNEFVIIEGEFLKNQGVVSMINSTHKKKKKKKRGRILL